MSCGGSGSGCGGPAENIQTVNERREFDGAPLYSSENNDGHAIWSDEVEAELGGGTGYKIVKEVPTCHGKYYEAYEIDERLAEFIIDLISKRREENVQPRKGGPR